MAANLGAHEVMELHEILCDTITGINTIQLYNEHCKDAELKNIVSRQLDFMTNEYNNLVNSIRQQGFQEAVPYRTNTDFSPTYGLRKPAPQTPNPSAREVDDQDVASALLMIHKCGASKRMMGALECSNPQLRRMLIQSAVNCADEAYEVWQFMNSRGFYQVPTMQQNTTDTIIQSYQPMGGTTHQATPVPPAGYMS
jgi:spore coat protein CotF